MTYRAIAWDVDGTLVDSEPLHLRALSFVSERFGVDLSDLADDAFVGIDMNRVWTALRDRYPATLTKATWIDHIDSFYVENSRDLVQIPCAAEVVHAFAQRGIRQAAVSNSGRRVVDANLGALGIADLFEFTLSVDDVPAGKPDPRPYLIALDRFQLAARDVLAVEDSTVGARSAAGAGPDVAFLGACAPSDIPIYHITSLSQIPDLFDATRAEIRHGI